MTNDMIQLLVNTDQNLLLYLNGFHNAFGDYFMSTFTGKWIWVPMYASILYVLLKNFNWKITLCLQFFRTGILSGLPVPQTMAEPFHSFMGHAELLYAHLPGSALSGRPHSRCHHRMLRSGIHVLFT